MSDASEITWMSECSVDCAVCGRYAGRAVHICDFAGIGVEPTCANICPSCVAALAAVMCDCSTWECCPKCCTAPPNLHPEGCDKEPA